jgi:hypothetical protein
VSTMLANAAGIQSLWSIPWYNVGSSW